MTQRYDKLGRRIPEYDRSAAGKKSAKTAKENHGATIHSRTGAIGGKRRSRGYFGYLKDQGKEDELRALAKAANQKSQESSRRRKQDSVDGDATK